LDQIELEKTIRLHSITYDYCKKDVGTTYKHKHMTALQERP